MTYTPEQEAIIEEILNPTTTLLKVQAIPGSAKSSTLVEAAKRLHAITPTAKFQYLVFGNLAASEAKQEFGTTAIVSTVHSLAYFYTVKPYKLNSDIAPFLSWRDMPSYIDTKGADFVVISSAIENYCNSGYLAFDSYVANEVDSIKSKEYQIAVQLLDAMASGKMRCTHSFYLKLFHILVMNKTIKLPAMDRLAFDEAQDASAIMLDLFEAIPATQKIMVGDTNQSIMQFLNLQNGFNRFKDGKTLTLTKSFRVHSKYAKAIELFAKTHFDPTIKFEGMDYPDNPTIETRAYLTRTNASLIAKMIELNKSGTPYRLPTDAKIKAMFKWPLAILYLKPGFAQKDPELKHLQQDANDWHTLYGNSTREDKPTLRSFISQNNKDNRNIQQAIKLLAMHKPEDIINAEKQAEHHKKCPASLQIMTAHASKGEQK